MTSSQAAIIKPQAANMPTINMNTKEIEEAMKKVKEAQALIAGTVDTGRTVMV